MLDVSEAVRRAAYCVLASKFPLQSLSIKLRTTLQRGLSDRSPSVTKECLKMLKDEWLTKCCGGDPVALLRFLDVETYESVGETVMEALLKAGTVRVQGQSIRQYLTPSDKSEGEHFSGIQLMDAEVALYWKTLCKHLQTVAQAKQIHVDVQRVATKCLCLFGTLEKRLSGDLVKQLRLFYISSPALVSVMASKALIDLVTWHGPEEVDIAIGLDPQNSNADEKNGFASVNLTGSNDDLSIGVLISYILELIEKIVMQSLRLMIKKVFVLYLGRGLPRFFF